MSTEQTLLQATIDACKALAEESEAALQAGLMGRDEAQAPVERLEQAAGQLLAALEGLANVSGGMTMQGVNRALAQHRDTILPAELRSKDDYLRLSLAPADRPRHI